MIDFNSLYDLIIKLSELIYDFPSQAYKKYVSKYGNGKDPKLPGFLKQFTGDQLFFISFASVRILQMAF